MPFYEVIYETGRQSVGQYENDEEALAATGAHHDRAVNGLPGGPVGAPAERVKRILKYDKHPGDWNPTNTLSKDVLMKELDELATAMADENGVVHVGQFAMEVRNLTHPMVQPEGSFDSQYKMKEAAELKLPWAKE